MSESSGSTYEGEFEKGLPSGLGVFRSINGKTALDLALSQLLTVCAACLPEPLTLVLLCREQELCTKGGLSKESGMEQVSTSGATAWSSEADSRKGGSTDAASRSVLVGEGACLKLISDDLACACFRGL